MLKKTVLYFYLIVIIILIIIILLWTSYRVNKESNETVEFWTDGKNGPKVINVKKKDTSNLIIEKDIEGEKVIDVIVVFKDKNNFESTLSTAIRVSEKNGGNLSSEVLNGQFLLEMKLIPNKSYNSTGAKKP